MQCIFDFIYLNIGVDLPHEMGDWNTSTTNNMDEFLGVSSFSEQSKQNVSKPFKCSRNLKASASIWVLKYRHVGVS